MTNTTISQKIQLLFMVFIFICMLLGAAYIYHKFINPAQPISYMPQIQAQTQAGVHQAATNAHVILKKEQEEEIAEAIKTPSKPVEQVLVQGPKVPETVNYLKMKHDAQMAIVTDPNNPNKPPVIPQNGNVNLDVHLIKAYPKQLLAVEYNFKNSVSVMNYWRVKVFNHYGYAGVGAEVNMAPEATTKIMPKAGLMFPH